MLKKKNLGHFSKKYRTFYPKNIVTKLSKIWVWDPGSAIRDPEKTYSGSRIQGLKSHRIPDLGSGSGSATLLEVPGLTCPGREANLGLHGGRQALLKRAIQTAC
jgi:hypothetical protein